MELIGQQGPAQALSLVGVMLPQQKEMWFLSLVYVNMPCLAFLLPSPPPGAAFAVLRWAQCRPNDDLFFGYLSWDTLIPLRRCICPAEQLSVEVCASGSSLQSRCEGRWGMDYGKAGDRANIQFHQAHGLIWYHAKVWFLLVRAKVLLGGCGFYCQMDEDGFTWGSGRLPGLSSSSLRSMHIHSQAAACASRCHFSLWLHVPVPYRCGEGSAVKLLALCKGFLSCKKKG